jgi:hypothetical protein
MICLQAFPADFLITPCVCTNPVHAQCLLSLDDIVSLDKCMVCKTDYVYSELRTTHLCSVKIKKYFPRNDVYYPTKNADNLVKYTEFERLEMAIKYVEVDRIKQLVQEKDILDHPNFSEYRQSYIDMFSGFAKTIATCTFYDDSHLFTMCCKAKKIIAILKQVHT